MTILQERRIVTIKTHPISRITMSIVGGWKTRGRDVISNAFDVLPSQQKV